MVLQLRHDNSVKWGFLESFETYRYDDTGSITVYVAVTPSGNIAPPYVMRQGAFIPAKVIDEEMGIERYLKAKKPFYTLLEDGFIARIKAGVNFKTGEREDKRSEFDIYSFSNVTDREEDRANLHLLKIIDVPDKVVSLIHNLQEEIAKCKGDRCMYLKSRIYQEVAEEPTAEVAATEE